MIQDPTLLLFAIAVGGGLGSVLRYYFSKFRGWLPWGILVANTFAATIATVAIFYDQQTSFSAVVVYGFAGGLSTFSSVIAQCFEYAEQRRYVQLGINAAVQVGLPMIGVALVTLVYFSSLAA